MQRILILVACLFLQSITFAASFDCTKAHTYVEKSICANKTLSFLDDYLNVYYTQLSSDEKVTAEEQKKWLAALNQCADVNCIQKAYQDRLNVLRQLNAKLLAAKKINLINTRKIISTLNGEWRDDLSNQYSGGILTISKATLKGFHFELNSFSGAHTGEVKGSAEFHDNDAVYVQQKDVEFQPDKTPCVLLFQFTTKSISVSTNNSCQTFAGIGVGLSGNYVKNLKPKVTTLVELGMLDTAEQEKKLAILAKKDYQLFVQGCGNVGEEDESFEPKAKVSEAFGRGLATVMGCVIMRNPNQIWAAVIDNETHAIKYFTDDAQYQNKLPKSISEWVAKVNTNNKYKVIFSGSKK